MAVAALTTRPDRMRESQEDVFQYIDYLTELSPEEEMAALTQDEVL